jgi:hypothetical protein
MIVLQDPRATLISHVALDQYSVLLKTIPISENSYEALTSLNIDDWLLQALDLIQSSSDASRVLDMLYNQPALLKALKAMDRALELLGDPVT